MANVAINLRGAFVAAFGGSADAVSMCRAPGRVNLIGEHTDYNGLPVLPMALNREIRVAFRRRDDSTVVLRDLDAAFPNARFENEGNLKPSEAGEWENYWKAAVLGLNRHLGLQNFPGFEALVDSDLPVAAGLSSSSALVVAAALAYLKVCGFRLGEDISRLELAEVLAEAEHYVGTRGGGMDQAVILNGRDGHACKIDFFPLQVELTPLPDDCVVVVCDSMVKVRKSGAALHRYNAGPASCALICALVQRQISDEFGEGISVERLGDLFHGGLCLTYAEAQGICERAVSRPYTTARQAAKRLDCSLEEVRERWLNDLPEPEDGFPLRARLRHQLTEYRRVEFARDVMMEGKGEKLGRLMNESHASCADDFFIGSPELDALADAARASGALGARLTGAGFGGAIVSLVPSEARDTFVTGVTERYYRGYHGYEGEPPVFVARACEGAGYDED